MTNRSSARSESHPASASPVPRWTAAALSCAAVCAPQAAEAIGFRIAHHDSEAIARANAFVATADNASAIHYNPAGITQLQGHNVRVGIHAISINSTFESEAGGTEHSKFAVQPVPHFFYAYAPEDHPFAYGFGVYTPFGLALDWGDDVQFNTLAIEGQLAYTTLNPIIAWRVHPTLSLAVGPTINYTSLYVRQNLAPIPGSEFRYRGNDISYGVKAGLRWQPIEQLAFGASYFSQTEVDLRGQASVKPAFPEESGTIARGDFPQFLMAGISYRPTTNWNFEVAVEWTDWNVVNAISFEGTPIGTVPFPLNWESSYIYEFGVTRELGNRWWVAAGYFFAENSTTDADFSPLVPDTDLHVGSIGVGQRGERWSWALSTHVAAGPERTINNGNAADGTYKWLDIGLNFTLGWHF